MTMDQNTVALWSATLSPTNESLHPSLSLSLFHEFLTGRDCALCIPSHKPHPEPDQTPDVCFNRYMVNYTNL